MGVRRVNQIRLRRAPDDAAGTARHRAVGNGLFASIGLVVLLAVALLGLVLALASGTQVIHSLAVLPLVDTSEDPSQDFFADGMTGELITELGKVDALRVISRTSAMTYKGAHKSLATIARELNVDAVIEGSVMRAGGRVRITAQLIHASDDEPRLGRQL